MDVLGGVVGREMEVVELAAAGESGSGGSGSLPGGGEVSDGVVDASGLVALAGTCSMTSRLLRRSSRDGRDFSRGLPNPSIRYFLGFLNSKELWKCGGTMSGSVVLVSWSPPKSYHPIVGAGRLAPGSAYFLFLRQI